MGNIGLDGQSLYRTKNGNAKGKMTMLLIKVAVEYNDDGYLMHAENYPGAFARSKTKVEALAKFKKEIPQYILWATGKNVSTDDMLEIEVVREKLSTLEISDADTDILFETERMPLSEEKYGELKALAIKSAQDFNQLYLSVPIKDKAAKPPRQTFYGPVPRTAFEMYKHTNNVTNYYVGEIGVKVNNLPDIVENRLNAFQRIEARPGYLCNDVQKGSYGEEWSLGKVLRRFIWHDRIHAKAMYRMAVALWGKENIKNPFYF